MGHRKKRVYQTPSAILSSDPPSYSESCPSSDDQQLDRDNIHSDTLASMPIKTPVKCKCEAKTCQAASTNLTYLLTILSASELKKSVAKRCPKTFTVRLNKDEPWDTVKAQFLVKITQALNPTVINWNNYSVTFYISRILPKPGASLSEPCDHAFLLEQANTTNGKELTINVVVTESVGQANKENEAIGNVEEGAKKQDKKKVRYWCFYLLLG